MACDIILLCLKKNLSKNAVVEMYVLSAETLKNPTNTLDVTVVYKTPEVHIENASKRMKLNANDVMR